MSRRRGTPSKNSVSSGIHYSAFIALLISNLAVLSVAIVMAGPFFGGALGYFGAQYEISKLEQANAATIGGGTQAQHLAPKGREFPPVRLPEPQTPPQTQILSAVQNTTGLGTLTVTYGVSDDNGNTVKSKVEFGEGTCANVGSLGSALLTNPVTVSYGSTPSLDNSETYQIGSATPIETNNGQNQVAAIWDAAADAVQGGNHCLKVTTADAYSDEFSPPTIDASLDMTNPTAPGNLTLDDATLNTVDGTVSAAIAFGAPSSDANFDTYRVFYKQGTVGVTENDIEFDSPALGFVDYAGTPFFIVSGLLPDTDYVINIWAYDIYCSSEIVNCVQNKSAAQELTFTTPAAPAEPQLSIDGIAQKTDGSGEVAIVLSASDFQGDPLKLKSEVLADSSCLEGAATWQTMSNLVGPVAVDYPTTPPDIDETETAGYYIGANTPIETHQGANQISYAWDLVASGITDGTYCYRPTAQEIAEGTLSLQDATQVFTVDTTNPTDPGPLQSGCITGTTATLRFGSASSDTNFSQYKIYYKAGATSGVTQNDTQVEGFVSVLAFEDYDGVSGITLTDLQPDTDYVMNIWAYDAYGFSTPAPVELSFHTLAVVTPYTPLSCISDTKDQTFARPAYNGAWWIDSSINEIVRCSVLHDGTDGGCLPGDKPLQFTSNTTDEGELFGSGWDYFWTQGDADGALGFSGDINTCNLLDVGTANGCTDPASVTVISESFFDDYSSLAANSRYLVFERDEFGIHYIEICDRAVSGPGHSPRACDQPAEHSYITPTEITFDAQNSVGSGYYFAWVEMYDIDGLGTLEPQLRMCHSQTNDQNMKCVGGPHTKVASLDPSIFVLDDVKPSMSSYTLAWPDAPDGTGYFTKLYMCHTWANGTDGGCLENDAKILISNGVPLRDIQVSSTRVSWLEKAGTKENYVFCEIDDAGASGTCEQMSQGNNSAKTILFTNLPIGANPYMVGGAQVFDLYWNDRSPVDTTWDVYRERFCGLVDSNPAGVTCIPTN